MDFQNNLKKEENRYYGEIELGVKIDSQLNIEEISSLLDEDSANVKIVLELPNGEQIKTEVLHVLKTLWQQWESI